MIYHDILGVNVLANASQIEDAYNNRIDSLKKSKFDIECPDLYLRKVQELANAKAKCLAYIKEPFVKKAELESKECAKKVFSPNVSYSCCCCDGVCKGCCIAIAVAAIVESICKVIKFYKDKQDKAELRQQEVERNRQARVLQERRARESQERLRLNHELMDTKQKFEEARRKHEEIKTRFSEFEPKLNIINEFLHSNGVWVDLKRSGAYVSLFQQTENAKNEEDRYKGKIRRIESDLHRLDERGIGR